MFDAIAPRPPSRRRQIFFAASGVLHGGAVLALIVAGLWRVDKLGLERQHVAIATMPPMIAGNSGGGAAKPRPADVKKAVVKHRVHDPVQPVPHVSTTEEPTTTTEVPDATGTGDGGGGDGKGSGEPTLGSGCIEGSLGCGTAELAPPPVDLPKPCSDPSRAHDADCQPKAPPHVIVEKLRLSGETQIQPADDTKVMMQREGQRTLNVAFEVCLDEAGAVTRTRRIGSTGYPEYDDRLAEALATWRYKPATIDGVAMAVCGPVTFHFTLR